MQTAQIGDIRLHYALTGPKDGTPVVFANSLGTDFRLWDKILPLLPEGLRILRFDKRGHGLSDAPAAPYSMGALISDTEKLMDHVGMKDAIFVGLSIGGMIAQGLAAKRLDLVRAVVLSNTAAKIGTRDMWNDRIAAVNAGGLGSIVDPTMDRWFSKPFHATDEFHAWRNMFLCTPPQGWTGCAAAISGTDFISSTSGLRLPALAIAGSEDGSTPPDLVFETAGLIPGAQTKLIRNAGHLPCVEQPKEYAATLTEFLKSQGHGA
ncbi:3-oxoadipate enol-lactonase [Tropicibacter naphthalenivorans]|uniref:3-oxoadipate enol-lactonase 2 n=1 Tax=Tropicibacter naphthalenivorans TaxID=441103 RepID=A0A0P1G0Z5_9RHOB|nr:3-oxoadipate enol-lactonase [Tropicibacter naphthalenivorans]CUH75167.1 3-oxoadipate enol-lactonase 2 [Tropicibacter naphthalenivorans]SMC45783.1 3-oxoadipate enol-lactonase [Tropicibacter naphthalenivorans]